MSTLRAVQQAPGVELSVVLPVRDEAATLQELAVRLTRVLHGLGAPYEVVLVDDGSTDGSWDVIREVARGHADFRGIRLSRNFGHQAALSAGIASASGAAVVMMDSDLQHPPEVIPALVARAHDGCDVVYAVRSGNDEASVFKRASARLFYRLFNRLSGLALPHSGGDYRLMSRRVITVLLSMPERRRFLRGMTRWIGFEQCTVAYDRPRRAAGTSKYTVARMLSFAWDAITSFSTGPLQVASVVGFAVSALGWLYFLYAVAIRLFTASAVPGWTSVIVAVLILGGVQLVSLGIVGQYLARVYEETKGRPLYVVAEETSPEPADAGG